MSSKKKIRLVFPSDFEGMDAKGAVTRGIKGPMKEFAAGVEDIANWFKDFNIDSIVISISGGFETGGITSLILSAKGEGGLTVTLKPKS